MRLFEGELTLVTAGNEVVDELAVLVQLSVGLGDDVITLLNGRQVFNLAGHLAVCHHAVRRLEEAVVVGARIDRHRVDQADVRAFRGFDRAHTAVMGRVYVANLEAGAFTGQAARAQRGNATLVSHF